MPNPLQKKKKSNPEICATDNSIPNDVLQTTVFQNDAVLRKRRSAMGRTSYIFCGCPYLKYPGKAMKTNYSLPEAKVEYNMHLLHMPKCIWEIILELINIIKLLFEK